MSPKRRITEALRATSSQGRADRVQSAISAQPFTAGTDGDKLAAALIRAQSTDGATRDDAVERFLHILRPRLLQRFRGRALGEEADDLTQVALIRISRAIPRIDPARAERYIAVVVGNLIRTAARRRKREAARLAVEVDVDTVATREGVYEEIERRADHERFVEALLALAASSMTPGLREVVVGMLRGLSADEIARGCGISPITVRTRLLRVRAMVERALAQYRQEGPRGKRRDPPIRGASSTSQRVAGRLDIKRGGDRAAEPERIHRCGGTLD